MCQLVKGGTTISCCPMTTTIILELVDTTLRCPPLAQV